MTIRGSDKRPSIRWAMMWIYSGLLRCQHICGAIQVLHAYDTQEEYQVTPWYVCICQMTPMQRVPLVTIKWQASYQVTNGMPAWQQVSHQDTTSTSPTSISSCFAALTSPAVNNGLCSMVFQSCTALVFSIDARTASLPRGQRSASYLLTAAASSADVCVFMARSWTRNSAASVIALLSPWPRSWLSLLVREEKAQWQVKQLTEGHGVGGISCQRYQAISTVPRLSRPVRQSIMPNHCALWNCQKAFFEWRPKCFPALVHVGKYILGVCQVGWLISTPGLHKHPGPLCRVLRCAIMNYERFRWRVINIDSCEYILLCQVKVPFGWKEIIYRGCSFRNAIEASRPSLVIVTLATIGDCKSSASFEPSKNSRVDEWAPSAPITRFPVSWLPSIKVIVTLVSPVSISFTRLPHCSLGETLQIRIRWATYMNINILGNHLQPLLSPQTKAPRCWKVLH